MNKRRSNCEGSELRLVCHFSCGVASAVATKLAIAENKTGLNLPVVILNEYIKQEHPDNKRFLSDCERWFGMPIKTITNPKYDGDIFAVFEDKKYIAGIYGATCTRVLKKELAASFWQQGDIDVIGYTVEEQDRYDRWIDGNNERRGNAILIDRGLTKEDCLAIIDRAGIEIPTMYKLGYEHNNCIGCVKAGLGYWNKIRNDFPDEFKKMAEYTRSKGVRILNTSGNVKIFLDELKIGQGNYPKEIKIQCGIFCELAEKELK